MAMFGTFINFDRGSSWTTSTESLRILAVKYMVCARFKDVTSSPPLSVTRTTLVIRVNSVTGFDCSTSAAIIFLSIASHSPLRHQGDSSSKCHFPQFTSRFTFDLSSKYNWNKIIQNYYFRTSPVRPSVRVNKKKNEK